MMIDLVALSKVVSHALRHEPWLYEMELDDEGWVPVGELLIALRAEKPEWSMVDEADLIEMIDKSDKKRHELHDGRVRALYGHSVPSKIFKQRVAPPAVLYHGTSPEAATLIRTDGLRPMGRQHVHLSIDKAMARQVGSRKSHAPTVLAVNASSAHASGVAFYRGNGLVWLANFVPAMFIE